MNDSASMPDALPLRSVLNGGAGGYSITRVLARGSYGITYLAEFIAHGNLGEARSGAMFAIKECFIGKVNGRDGLNVTGTDAPLFRQSIERFTRESKMLSDISHPGVISVIDAFEANNTAYYVMEYVDGGTVDAEIMRAPGGALPERRALAIIRQAAEAVAHIHSLGMAHLDIKPANIMLRPDGSAAVIDFGISRSFGPDGTATDDDRVVGGTECYAPPEQALPGDDSPLLVPMDVYALGGTLFKMLSGERPPKAAQITSEGFPSDILSRRSVSAKTIAAIARAMCPTPEGRLKSAAHFLAALPKPEDITEDSGGDDGDNDVEIVGVARRQTQHKPTPAPNPPKKSSIRPKLLWGCLIAAALAAAYYGIRQYIYSPYTDSANASRYSKYGHTAPANFDLCATRDDRPFYFTVSEWAAVPATVRPLYQLRGVYLHAGTAPFLVALKEDRSAVNYERAEARYSNIPAIAQARAMVDNASELNYAIHGFGGDALNGRYWALPQTPPKWVGTNDVMFFTGNLAPGNLNKVRRVFTVPTE